MLPTQVYTPERVKELERINAMDDQARAGIGHNEPPEPTPFEAARQEIDDLFGEAKNWADGTPIENQAHADAIAELIALLRAAGKRAEDARKLEAKPFDDGKAEVQARYNPLIQTGKGRVDMALASLKKVLEPYRLKLEAAAKAEADIARAEADEARRVAQEAFQASQVTDLGAREEAEKLLANAKEAEAYASRAAKQTGAIKGTRLLTVKRAEITDMKAFAAYVWTSHKRDLEDFLTGYATELVRAKVTNIPGVNIIEERALS